MGFDINVAAAWAGFIISVSSTGFQIVKGLANRAPKLAVITPTGVWANSPSGQSLWAVVMRFSNSSERTANLDLWTIQVELYYQNKWQPVFIGSHTTEQLRKLFTAPEHKFAGVEAVPAFDKFEYAVVSREASFTRIVPLISESHELLHRATKIRVRVQDGTTGKVCKMENILREL